MYDILAALIIVMMVYAGGKKGFLKTIVIIAGYIIAFVAAGAASAKGSEAVYDKFIKNTITTGIENAISDADVIETVNENLRKYNISIKSEHLRDLLMMSSSSTLAQNLKNYLEEYTDISVPLADLEILTEDISNGAAVSRYIGDAPVYTASLVNEMLNMTRDEVMHLIRSMLISEHVAAEYIEENFIRESVISLLRVIIYALIFSITLTITRIIAGVFGKANKIPIAGKLNMALGALLGFIRAALLLLTIAIGLKIIILLTDNALAAVNTQVIEDTVLFKYIYTLTDKII